MSFQKQKKIFGIEVKKKKTKYEMLTDKQKFTFGTWL